MDSTVHDESKANDVTIDKLVDNAQKALLQYIFLLCVDRILNDHFHKLQFCGSDARYFANCHFLRLVKIDKPHACNSAFAKPGADE